MGSPDDPADDGSESARREKLRSATDLLVRELVVFDGPVLPPLSVARLKRLAEAAVEPLLGVLVDSRLRDPGGPGGGWAPVHAAALLGAMGVARTLEPLLDVLATAAPPSELYSALALALKPFGAALIKPVLDRLPTAVGPYRQELWMLLANAKVRDPRILDQLLVALAEQPEEGAMRLTEYGDPAALPHLQRVLDTYRPRLMDDSSDDSIVFELHEAISELGGTLTPAQRRKYEHARITRTIEESLLKGREQPYDPDAPCHCKSGRLYKYCCLQ